LGTHLYLVALGSNMRHHRHGAPRAVIARALAAIEEAGIEVVEVASTHTSRPLGPSLRDFANSAAIVRCALAPPAMLALLQRIERDFGRRRRGARWRARPLDLDIVLWSGGIWRSGGLTIPHPRYRERRFVLDPARAIAGQWRDPQTGLSVLHQFARLTRRRAVPR